MSSVDYGHENESAATPAEQITVDGSVGSDTDTGAPTKTDPLNDDGPNFQHHARSNSVKKPTPFKALSVTKNFLAKAGPPITANPKVNGENTTVNGAGSGPAALRPRLVAKSSGTKQAKAHFASRNGAGPDPMQVWNRNRATPQHPPKHLTDEELKQQYGIHLATRIQADGDGKEAKWADIDDDEDDWAPESIEWNDGTKITLSQNDSAALLAEQQAAIEAARKREEEEKKAKAAKAAAEKKPTTTVGPNATVLKPRSTQSKPGTPLVLKTPTEKPTLVSKPTTSTPAKSPWAPLPAVDKVPPIDINPPTQISAPRLQPNGVQPSPVIQSPSQPALEIAADSFRRGGPESQKDIVGQLYNDKSGKYEPAAAGRRGSVRKDGNFRAPSVLQRGGQAPDTSAIIEGNRFSQDEIDPQGRRKSSTFSAESGAQARRQSMNRGFDSTSERRESQQSQVMQSPSTQSAQLSATESPGQDARLPGAYKAGPGSGTSNAASERDDVALQRQLMKEKREQAIKRRKEEEESEEAAKKERIRKKLESLGMEPVAEKTEEIEVPAVTIEKRPAETPGLAQEKMQDKDSAPKEVKSPMESPTKFPKSPPKPPVPTSSGEPLQYGMMKVHAPGPRDPLQQVNDTLASERVKFQAPVHKVSRHTFETQSEAPKETEAFGQRIPQPNFEQRDRTEAEGLRQSQPKKVSPPGFESRSQEDIGRASPLLNGTLTPNRGDHLFSRSPELTNQRPHGEVRQQPWNDGLRDSRMFSGWTSQHLMREPSNVWGVPSQSRPLGNGVFDRTIQRPQSRHQDQYPSPALAPIGPPKHLQQAKDAPDTRSPYDASLTTGLEDSQTIPSFPQNESLSANLRHTQSRLTNGDQKEPSPRLPPVAQFEPQRNEGLQQLQGRDRGAALAAWKDLPTVLVKKEADERRQALMEREARKAEEARTGIAYQPQMQFKEKWSQVEVAEHGFGRKITGVVRSLKTLGPGPSNPLNATAEIRGPSFVNSTDLSNTMPGGLGRGSRFFPTAGRLHPYQQSMAPFTPFYRHSDSPPPPDSVSHPAHALETRRIVVRLPFSSEEGRPKPKVKLPPSVTTPVQSPQPAPAQLLSLRPTPQPLVNNPSWQERFNSMLGTKKMSNDKSPERSMSQLVDFSATKEPLTMPSPRVQAAVALPPRGEIRSPTRLDVASQSFQDEEALFEPEAGSMPAVQFPVSLGLRPWQGKPLKREKLRDLPPSSQVYAVTVEPAPQFSPWNAQNMITVTINILGSTGSKTVFMQPPAGYHPPTKEPQPHQAPSSQYSHAQKPRQQGKGYKPRDQPRGYGHGPKTDHNAAQKGAGTGPRNNLHRNSNGQQRGPAASQRRYSWESVIAT